MATATETFAVGAEQATVVVEIDLNTVWLISGDFAGTIPSGQIGFINGNVNLTGDLIVEGLLTGIDTFTLTGNGFQLLAQDGGQINLQGVAKSGWVRWGEPSTGWQTGDRLGITPTKVGIYTPIESLWTGDWNTLVRPSNAPDVTLAGGTVALPEVANLARTIVLQNLRRIHFHDGAGVQTLKWLKVLNSGTVGVLADYPIHFHLNGETSRGSLIEGVLVEGGKNHAFVQHGSHGTTLSDCVAWNTTNDAYWWDPPPEHVPHPNDSHDTTWQHCLAVSVVQTPGGSTDHTLTAFNIGAGNGDRCVDCVAACVKGTAAQPAGSNISGFLWRQDFVWEFTDNVAHNIQKNGIYTWTNSSQRHIIDGFVAYNFGKAGIEHGAYRNQFVYRNVSLTVTSPIVGGSKNTQAIRQHANSNGAGLLFENIFTDDRLIVDHHGLPPLLPAVHRNCHYTGVFYTEAGGSGPANPSHNRYEDCGLVPAKFTLGGGIVPTSIIEIVEAGVLTHRWAGGVWT